MQEKYPTTDIGLHLASVSVAGDAAKGLLI